MIVVTMQGGLLVGISTDDPALVGKEIVLIDYDVEGSDSDELHHVPQGSGQTEEAAISRQEIGVLYKPVAKFLKAKFGENHNGDTGK